MRYISKGILYLLFSAVLFSIMSVLVKLLGARIPATELVFSRALITLLLCLAMLYQAKIRIFGNNKPFLILRGAFGTAGLFCVYWSLTHLPLADAVAIQFTNPIFASVLAAIFLKERVSKWVIIAIIVSLLGVAMITKPSFLLAAAIPFDKLVGVGIALLGAFFSGAAYVTVRKLRFTDDPLVVVLYFPLLATPVSLPFLWADFVLPIGWEWVLLVGIGLATHFAQVFMTKGLHREKASVGTSIGYIQLVLAVIWGILIFKEIPDTWSLTGAICILASSIILTWSNRRIKKI